LFRQKSIRAEDGERGFVDYAAARRGDQTGADSIQALPPSSRLDL